MLPSYYFDSDTDQVENLRANLWTYTRQQRKNGRSLANGVNDENDLDLSSTVGVGAKRRRPAGLDDDYGLDSSHLQCTSHESKFPCTERHSCRILNG